LAPARFDPDRPHLGRVHDWWLGGNDNYPPDWDLAARIEHAVPQAPDMVRESRLFTARTVGWAVSRPGIRQFLALGSGLPTCQPVHKVARSVLPDARIAYVDDDPVIASRAQRIIDVRDGDGVAVAEADLRDVGGVLAHPALEKVIDPAEPLLVLMTLVLHLMPAHEARAAVAGYAAQLAPGSVIAVSLPVFGDGALAQARSAFPGAFHPHSRQDVAEFLAGLDLVVPGVVAARGWRAEMPDSGVAPADVSAYVACGAGRVGRRRG
jgi:O-methyltransferase involved in polyketide biosynthesis